MQWRIHVSDVRVRAQRAYHFGTCAVRIGRGDEVEVKLDAADISRVHCTLLPVGGRLRVADSSRNGTFLREAAGWRRLRAATELDLPLTLRAGDWTIDVAVEPELPVAPDERLLGAAADWEQSILLGTDVLPAMEEAILVFDLCESSHIASRDDRMAYHLKQRLAQITEPVLEICRPRFFKSTGDGFLATFTTPATACAAAVALEQRIAQRNQRTANLPLHFRMALHMGKVWSLHAGGADIHGNDVNIACRLEGVQVEAFDSLVCDFPARDRILCSHAFISALPATVCGESGASHVVCGEAHLKGIAEHGVVHWLRTPHANA
jgi:class 3 adenylate cyclase